MGLCLRSEGHKSEHRSKIFKVELLKITESKAKFPPPPEAPAFASMCTWAFTRQVSVAPLLFPNVRGRVDPAGVPGKHRTLSVGLPRAGRAGAAAGRRTRPSRCFHWKRRTCTRCA